jgi:hypothetical protein
MTSASSDAVLALTPLDYAVWPEWQHNGDVDPSIDLSTATDTGRIADIIGLAIRNSGMPSLYIVEFKPHINEEAIALLHQWIEEYGCDRDSDLDEQIEDLNRNRLLIRGQC